MKTWQSILFGVLCGLLGTGIVYLISRPARGAPIRLLPAPTPVPLFVQIVGAVHQPGVYQFSPGSRLNDAVQAAGGLLAEADASQINLAAPLTDGSLVTIPYKAELNSPALDETDSAPSPDTRSGPVIETGPVNINTATLEELESLPEIGPVIAQRILDYRQANGPFTTLEAIQNVDGIGPVTFEQIKGLITINPAP